jgi:Skp family chaperone for outer membrane proteins
MEVNDGLTEVPGSVQEGGVSANETPAQGGVAAAPVTPNAQPPVDVEVIRAEYEQKLQRYEKDINAMKSSLQRREAQVEQEWRKRYNDLQSQLHQVRMQGMTEEERERYERQLESEEFQSLQSRLAELENEKAQQVATVNAFSFFINQGVPADKLNLSEGYDAVVSSGWQYLTEELARLRQAAANPQPQPAKVEPAPLKEAPKVVNDKGIPATGTTWAALRATYGSDEAVYRAVEEGRLSPSVIPTS